MTNLHGARGRHLGPAPKTLFIGLWGTAQRLMPGDAPRLLHVNSSNALITW